MFNLSREDESSGTAAIEAVKCLHIHIDIRAAINFNMTKPTLQRLRDSSQYR
jgi:hypothetical protein